MNGRRPRQRDRFPAAAAAGAGLVALMILAAAGMGYVDIGPMQAARILWARLGGAAPADPTLAVVLLEVRLPRIVCAAAVGGGLAVAGVVFQGILHNPLADPYTLGVSSGAAFGASLALLLGMETASALSVPLSAFAGAALTLVVVTRLASFGGRMRPGTMILAGVIVSAILAAGISFMKFIADEQVSVLVFWLMGSLASRGWDHAAAAVLASLAGLAATLVMARDLDILACGDRAAASLGVDPGRARFLLLTAATLTAAVCVSVSGIIGFIGLIVPHLMRSLVGPGNRRLALASFLAGAALLLAADTLTRAVLPQEVPVGVLTALLGGPFFCYIFRRDRGMA